MATVTYRVSASGVGGTFSKTATRTGDVGASVETSLAVAKAGTLTTRTDATHGVITLASGHGFTTSSVVAVYSTGAVAYNCTVSATTSTTITIATVAGDNLPALNSAVRVSLVTEVTAVFAKVDLQIFAMELANNVAGVVGHCVVIDDGDGDANTFDLVSKEPIVNDLAGGEPHIFGGSGSIAKFRVSHDGTDQASTFTAIWLTDGT